MNKYLSSENGGGDTIVANRDSASGWETFKVYIDTYVTSKLHVSNFNDDDNFWCVLFTWSNYLFLYTVVEGQWLILQFQSIQQAICGAGKSWEWKQNCGSFRLTYGTGKI